MALPILERLAETFRDSSPEEPVHFHQGPTGEPAVCYDARCSSPRLSV